MTYKKWQIKIMQSLSKHRGWVKIDDQGGIK